MTKGYKIGQLRVRPVKWSILDSYICGSYIRAGLLEKGCHALQGPVLGSQDEGGFSRLLVGKGQRTYMQVQET